MKTKNYQNKKIDQIEQNSLKH